MNSTNESASVADNQDLILQPMVLTIGDLVRLKQSHKIEIPKAYQRRYLAWKLDKFSSFVIGNWRGFSAKDSYIIVDIQACFDNEMLKKTPDKEFLNHLQGYLDGGYTFLVVDGQHRIESNQEYINGKIPKFVKGVDQIIILDDNKVNLKLDFMSLPQSIKDFYLNQPVQVSMVTKATLPNLKKLFVTSNDGNPLKPIEKAMAGNAPNAVDLVLDIVEIEHYRNFLGKMAGIKAVSKTDCELVAKLLMIEHDRESVNVLPSQIEYLFHTDIDGYKSTSKSDVKRLKKNFGILYDSLSPQLKDEKNKFSTGKFINMYMLISLITDSRLHSLMEHYFDNTTRFKIEDEYGFGDWFLKREAKLMKGTQFSKDDDGNDLYITTEKPVKENGVIVMKKSKVQQKDEYGYYYATTRESNGDWTILRQKMMLEDFKEWVESSASVGIIKQYDTTTITKSVREKVLVESNFKSSAGKDLSWKEAMNGNSFHVDHIIARDNQGSSEVSNLQMMDSKSNINKSNKEI
jgi:hypothetical protein